MALDRGYGRVTDQVDEQVAEFLTYVSNHGDDWGDCGFCPDAAVMIVNGIAMCQRCGDEDRDKKFHAWLLTQAVD